LRRASFFEWKGIEHEGGLRRVSLEVMLRGTWKILASSAYGRLLREVIISALLSRTASRTTRNLK
jgi:hypothetical protein